MVSLSLGLVAALCWGVHDLLVRRVSTREGTFAALLAVLVFGGLFALPLAAVLGDPLQAPARAWGWGALAGLFYAGAGIGLFKAFEIGPVRLVAPIIGAYPLLSMLWAAWSGSPLEGRHWLAVVVVIGGVAVLAASSHADESRGRKPEAIWWSLLAGTGFALAFAVSQAAARVADEWTVMLPLRGSAFVVVLAVGWARRARIRPRAGALRLFAVMGALDVAALLAVAAAGGFAHPEFAAVAASTFGLVTVLLASLVLGEHLRAGQWATAVTVFLAIASLGL